MIRPSHFFMAAWVSAWAEAPSPAHAHAHAQGRCQPIRFNPGASSAEIHGTAPAEDVVCYTLATGNGQAARVSVTGSNVIVTVLDVADARDRIEFRTQRKTYTLLVGQLMRAVQPERFVLSVSVH
ncbi:hypothetical protein [Roseomonas xinghualingensis]